MKDIIEAVEWFLLNKDEYSEFNSGFIFLKTRKREIAVARQICCYLRYNQLKSKIDNIHFFERNINELIADEIGLNQATVRYSVKAITGLIEVDRFFKKDIEDIEKHLYVDITKQDIHDSIIAGLIKLLKSKL